jgi:glutathione S-transferase
MQNPVITAFADSPDEGQGLARDMRVRWALEEIGQPYDVRLVPMARLKDPSHLARNPFGQIPTYEDGDVTLFESGAIILDLVQRHAGLMPGGSEAQARAVMWIFAALNTVEPPIVELEQADLTETDKSWYGEHRAAITARVAARLEALSAWLGDRDWLESGFSVGDLMMVMVLRRLDGTGIVERYSNLAAYVARGVARPAYQRAFAAQLAVFEESKAA